MSKTEQLQFQAETQKLLNIIIHSIYTNKEIFLRELISNSSDALDKVRFEQSRGAKVKDPEKDLEIRIKTDKDNSLLTITDTGIGMSREDIINNLGTIAKSGTEEFLKKVSEEKENPDNIIGRFGVGFYSVFMVATQVKIRSNPANPELEGVFWESDGMGSYSVTALDQEQPRGTSIEVHLNKEAEEFLEPERIKSIIKKHSNFISFPIYVNDEKVNTIPALWKESKFNVTQEQYKEFYKFLTFDSNEPLKTIHISVDAPVQFNSLLFIPPHSTAFFENYYDDYGLDLYVNRVLIQHKFKDLIPQYLGFLKGVVDSADLPLNLARESIQESALINKIKNNITKQVLSKLQSMADSEPENYEKFWNEHSKVFKLGYTDFANKDRFSKLLRFNSSHHEDSNDLTSLKEYMDRMKIGQKEIYYISGPTRESIVSSPHLEMFSKKGIEVLFLFEPIDEFVLQHIEKFEDYQIKAAEHTSAQDLKEIKTSEEASDSEKELSKDEKADLDKLLSKMKEILGERVTEVRSSDRLSSSPACLINPESGISSQMQKIMHIMSKDQSIPKQILEVNPTHELTKNLLKIYKSNPEDSFIHNSTEQLFEVALLNAGYLSDPHKLINRTHEILSNAGQWYTQLKEMN